MIPSGSRIKYDDVAGIWKVLWNAKQQSKSFKTSAEAMQHLQDLKDKKIQPET